MAAEPDPGTGLNRPAALRSGAPATAEQTQLSPFRPKVKALKTFARLPERLATAFPLPTAKRLLMLESPLHLLLLLPGIVLLTFGLAYAFQNIEDRAEAKSRCRACQIGRAHV